MAVAPPTPEHCSYERKETMIRWSQERRRKVYSRIVKEIGRHKDWGTQIEPLRKKQEYNRLLSELASELHGAPSAIQQQINFATTEQKSLNNRSHVANFILNTAAALEAGFISTRELPNQLISN